MRILLHLPIYTDFETLDRLYLRKREGTKIYSFKNDNFQRYVLLVKKYKISFPIFIYLLLILSLTSIDMI